MAKKEEFLKVLYYQLTKSDDYSYEKLQKEILKYTESLQLHILKKGVKKLSLSVGKKYKFYDLASLTKVMFAVSAVAYLIENNVLGINDKVSKYLPWLPFKDLKIKDLLNHNSGYPAWEPIYKYLKEKAKSNPDKWVTVAQFIYQTKRKSKKPLYSDVGFVLLGLVLQEVTGLALDKLWKTIKKKTNPKEEVFFLPGNITKGSKKSYAPTKRTQGAKEDCQGVVNDLNAYSLDGVSTHAGLFGTPDAIVEWLKMSRKNIKTNKTWKKLFNPKSTKSIWINGFMKPDKDNSAAGDLMSRGQSIGHWGFTGPSAWMDLENDVQIAVAANRKLPDEKNNFKILRRALHDAVIKYYGEKK